MESAQYRGPHFEEDWKATCLRSFDCRNSDVELGHGYEIKSKTRKMGTAEEIRDLKENMDGKRTKCDMW
jgi:hypothetical protein